MNEADAQVVAGPQHVEYLPANSDSVQSAAPQIASVLATEEQIASSQQVNEDDAHVVVVGGASQHVASASANSDAMQTVAPQTAFVVATDVP